MFNIKHAALAGFLAACVFAAAASGVLAASSGETDSTQEHASPFESVTTPTGKAMPQEAILQIAAGEAAQDGEADPTMALGSGTLLEAMGTFTRDFNMPEPVTDPGYQRLLDTPVDVVLMRGSFTLANAPVRAGSQLPRGDAMFVVIDSHRGLILGRGLPTPQALVEAEAKSPAYAAKTRAIALHPAMGTISGVLHVSGGRAHKGRITDQPTHAVLIQRHRRTIKVVHTNSRGRFSVRLSPGTYSLEGTAGSDCQPKTAALKANQAVRVTLVCSVL